MNRLLRLASTAGAAGAAAATLVLGLSGPASAATASSAAGATATRGAHPVFVQTDALTGNAVVAYDRAADGHLVYAATYPTGGLGGILDGAVVDHTASQGALAYDARHGLLYAVNAGSNTITVFRVHGDRLTWLQTTGSGGIFPVSIAVHGDAVYVLNARNGGSVQGFVTAGAHLFRIASWHRSLGLDPTATPEFTHTPGQVAVTPDGQHLVVTTKAGGQSIVVYGLTSYGRPSTKATVNDAGGTVPFAVTFDAAGHLVVARAGDNAVATYRIARNGTVTEIDTAATGQAATCWVVRDGRFLFASNAGSATLTEVTVGRHGGLSLGANTGTSGGTVDAAVSSDGRTLDVQGGAAGTVDAFRVGRGGVLTLVGTVTVPDAAGGEGIVAL